MRFLLSAILIFTIFNSIKAQTHQCSYLGKCVEPGQRCDAGFYYNTTEVPVYRITVQCKEGYFCPNEDDVYQPTCTAYSGLGESCNTDSPYQQCGAPYSCYRGTCQVIGYSAVGESCSFDAQCSAYTSQSGKVVCYEGKCGMQPRTQCSSDTQCPVGYFCNMDLEEWESNQCLPVLNTGDVCDRPQQCAADSMCVKVTETSEYTCQKQFSKKNGDFCGSVMDATNYIYFPPSSAVVECDVGFSCVDQKCASQETANTQDACESDSDCNYYGSGAQCLCPNAQSFNSTGKCSAPVTQFNAKCKTAYQNLQECAIKNSCSLTVDTIGPDSCIIKNCRTQYCSTDCEVLNASQQCGEKALSVCNLPSSSSTVIPSFIALIAVIVALLI